MMATAIAVYNSDGCVGRCDAKCHEATEPECECICGGKNHGAGHEQAFDNTAEYAQAWIEAYIEKRGLIEFKAIVPAQEGMQLSLF